MYAQLGNIKFEGLIGFNEFERKRETVLPQHKRIDGKPRLQRTGDKLDEVKLKIRFHSRFTNPEEKVRELNQLRSDAEVLPFIMGSGEFIGDFVIRSLTDKVEFMTPKGEVVSVIVELSLLEFYDPDKAQTEAERAVDEGFAMTNNTPTPAGEVDPVETDVAAVSANANETLGAANDTNKDIEDFEADETNVEAVQRMIKNAQRASAKAQNTISRTEQSSADVQSSAANLKSNTQNVKNNADALASAASSGDPAAIKAAANLFQSSTTLMASSTGDVFVLAALRKPV